MNDRELLELVAKVPGVQELIDDLWATRRAMWSPLTDDGDALRLAVKLGIEIYPDRDVSEVVTAFCVHRPNLIGLNAHEEFGNDEMAATRRAIVRAAAEIGRQMEVA